MRLAVAAGIRHTTALPYRMREDGQIHASWPVATVAKHASSRTGSAYYTR
jgi:hypothetical protein